MSGRARGIDAVQIASLGDIIASKQWADRPKDREALPELVALSDVSPDADRDTDRDIDG